MERGGAGWTGPGLGLSNIEIQTFFNLQNQDIYPNLDMAVSKTSDNMQIKIKITNPGHGPPVSSKGQILTYRIWMFFPASKLVDTQYFEHI